MLTETEGEGGKRVGRPRKAKRDRRTVRIALVLSPAERAHIRREARSAGMGASAWIRSVIFGNAKARSE